MSDGKRAEIAQGDRVATRRGGYAIRTVLAGRADELLDLVTTNVARRILD